MKRGGGTVYFIRPIGMDGPVKIGCSGSPASRRTALDTWSPFALEIIATIPGDFQLERRFHALFRKQHQRREWFLWSPLMGKVVAAINDGSFDIDTLPPPACLAQCDHGNSRKRTKEQRRQFSVSLRCTHMERRTGYACPVQYSGAVSRADAAELAVIERFLANPETGKPIGAVWAQQRRAAWALKHQHQIDTVAA